MLPTERVGVCMRCTAFGARRVDVMYSPTRGATYRGLAVCGSVWLCPVCAGRIAEVRRGELERAILGWHDDGHEVYFATRTISHKRSDGLDVLLRRFLAANRRLKGMKAYRALLARYGVVGTIRALEVTHGINGWHPHCHELVFADGPVDVAAFRAEVSVLWRAAAAAEGLSADDQHGCQVAATFGAVGDYVAKFGRLPSRPAWGPEAEMTRAHLKRGRRVEGVKHRSPFELLADCMHGDKFAGVLFREYAACFKGRNQLLWSPGLRARLLGDAPAISDEAAAASLEPDSILLGSLSLAEWRAICWHEVRGDLLDVASADTGQAGTFADRWARVRAFVDAVLAAGGVPDSYSVGEVGGLAVAGAGGGP